MTAPFNIMKLIKNLLFYISVPKCVHCNERLARTDVALCNDCLREYYNQKAGNCSVCARPLYECTCSMKYLDSHFIHKLIKLFRYKIDRELPSNDLIYSLKRDNRSDVIDFLSDELCYAINTSVKLNNDYVVTSVPRMKKSISKYGYDHAEKLARAIAKKLGLKYEKILLSQVKTEQKHSKSREERYKNARFLTKKRHSDMSGEHILLIDDIVTTGASMSACSMLLKGLGAKSITGAAVAIAFRDEYTPFTSTDHFDT